MKPLSAREWIYFPSEGNISRLSECEWFALSPPPLTRTALCERAFVSLYSACAGSTKFDNLYDLLETASVPHKHPGVMHASTLPLFTQLNLHIYKTQNFSGRSF